MNMKRSHKIASFLLTVIVAAVCIRAITSPVLVRFKDPSAVDPGDGLYVLFSPVRSRAPERVADKFFQRLKQGECGIGLTAIASEYCERERRYKITGWTLVDSAYNSDGSVGLQYKVYVDQGDQHDWRNAWVSVSFVRGAWEPSSYSTYY
jgi:hypothetical protein